jgi:hypothetical protein
MNTLERYRDEARDVLTEHDPRIVSRPHVRLEAFGLGDFEDAICRLVQAYVGHDLDWAAREIEHGIEEFQRVAHVDPAVTYVLAAFADIAATIRRRGQP